VNANQKLSSIIAMSAKRRFRSGLDRLVAHAGYVRRGDFSDPVDFRGILANPVEALARSRGRPVLLDVKLKLCRGLRSMSFPLTPEAAHPLVMTARKYLTDSVRTYSGSPLEAYYATVRPRNACEMLGLECEDPEAYLNRVEALKGNLPWAQQHGMDATRFRDGVIRREAYDYGYGRLTVADGWKEWGPTSTELGNLEMERICRLTDCIVMDGYSLELTPKPVLGGLLLRDGETAIMIGDGQHRAAVLAALAQETIPIVLLPRSVTDRRSVADWPGVRSGVFTQIQALSVFDRVFAGRQPNTFTTDWPRAWLLRGGLNQAVSGKVKR